MLLPWAVTTDLIKWRDGRAVTPYPISNWTEGVTGHDGYSLPKPAILRPSGSIKCQMK